MSTATTLSPFAISRIVYAGINQRALHEVILNFLEGCETLVELQHLGISPSQLEALSIEEELAYFQPLMPKFTQDPSLLLKLRDHFPKVAEKICENLAVEQVQREQAQMGSSRYEQVLRQLGARVAGQLYALQNVTNALSKNSVDNARFLFVGPPGTGKTELALVAGEVKGNKKFIKV